MKLGINAKLEEKLTCAFQNDMRNLAYFYQSTLKTSKSRLWWDPFIQSKKPYDLKIYKESCVMTMKNDAKFVKGLTCCFKIDMKNLKNFDPSTQKSKNFPL